MAGITKTLMEKVLDFASEYSAVRKENAEKIKAENNKQGYVLIPADYVKAAMKDMVSPTVGERLGYSVIMTPVTAMALISGVAGAGCGGTPTIEGDKLSVDEAALKCLEIATQMAADAGCAVFDERVTKDITGLDVITSSASNSGLVSGEDYNCVIECKADLCATDGTFCETASECSAETYLLITRQGSEVLVDQVVTGASICTDSETY